MVFRERERTAHAGESCLIRRLGVFEGPGSEGGFRAWEVNGGFKSRGMGSRL